MEGKCRHIWRRRETWRKRDGLFVFACKPCRYKWAKARLILKLANKEN